MSGKIHPRSSRRQEAQTEKREENQSLVTSAPTNELREEAPPYRVNPAAPPPLRFIDLFCGIGGFRYAFERAGGQCVFSSDWNKYSRQTYAANFGEEPHGDIHAIAVVDSIRNG